MSPYLGSGTVPRRIRWKCWGLVFIFIAALMNNLTLFWNGSCQIPMSLFSKMHDVWGIVSPVNKMTVVLFAECLWQKKSNFHRRLLPLWSAHVCAVLPGFHWPLRRFAWNNGKLLTQGSLLNGARRLHHCDVIASLAPRAQQSWHSKPNVIHGNSLGLNTSCVLHMDWKHDIKPAGQLMSFIWYHPCDCSYSSTEGVKMLNRFPATRWPRRHVQWEQCGTNFGGKIANLRVSCYNGNNDRYMLGCCSSSTLGSRANDYVNNLAYHSPCCLRCWMNNTLAGRSLSPK